MVTRRTVVVTCDTVYPNWGPCRLKWEQSDPERQDPTKINYDLRKAKWLRIDGVDYCPVHHPLPAHRPTDSSQGEPVTVPARPYHLPPKGYVPPVRCRDCWIRIYFGPVVGGHMWQHLSPPETPHLVVMREAGWFDTATGRTRHDLGMGE